MKWKQIDAYYWERECKRYTVDMVASATSVTGQRCTAWRRGANSKEIATNLGCFDRLNDAFQACADDLRQQHERAQAA